MLNLIPTLPGAASAAKITGGSGAGADNAKSAAADSTGNSAKTGGTDSGNAPSSASEFQNLLNAQTAQSGQAAQTALSGQAADTPKQAFGSISPDLLANLKTDGDATPGQPLRGRSAADKAAETALAAAPTAPASDLAALIGASAAAGSAAVSHAALALANAAAGKNTKTGDAGAALTAIDTGSGGAVLPSAALATGIAGAAIAHGNTAAAALSVQTGATAAIDNNATIAALQAALQNNVPAPAAKEHSATDTAILDANALPQSLTGASGNAVPASNTAIAGGQIDMPVGSQGWDQALGQRVVWMVSQKDQTAEIHVNPPELGPLSVTVNVNNNTASASFVAAHAATRDAINDAMPKLRDMFADAGINLGQVSVSAESFSQGGQNAGQAWQGRPDTGATAAGSAATAGASSAISPLRTSRAQLGMVDTFA